MTDIEQFKIIINDLADRKGWMKDQVWLMYSLFKEVGELCNAIEHNESEEVIGSEYSDVMHFLTQLMIVKAPSINLDHALHQKIFSNEARKKKTYQDGEFVRK